MDAIEPNVQAELTAQRFLGLRIRCAQCHDHPFDIWTQDAYFGLASFFAKVQRGGAGGPGAMMGKATDHDQSQGTGRSSPDQTAGRAAASRRQARDRRRH